MIELIESIDGKILRVEEYDGRYGEIVAPYFDYSTLYNVGDVFVYHNVGFEVIEIIKEKHENKI